MLFDTGGSMQDAIISPKKWVDTNQNHENKTFAQFTERKIELFLAKAAQKLYNL